MPGLKMFTVYKSPRDFPGEFVVREFTVDPRGPVAGPIVARGPTLEPLRCEMEARGLFPLPRSDGDDPSVVETWI